MITDGDVKKLKKTFATKDDLQEFKSEVKNDLVEFKDAILKEIRDLRDDVTVTTGYRDMIEEHEDRLNIVEIKLKLSPKS